MARQTINIGTGVNTKDGDTVRIAFQKTNDNFQELYDAITASVNDLNTYSENIEDSSAVALDLANGKNWLFTGTFTGNWILDLNNLNLAENQVTTLVLFVTQGGTGFLPETVLINNQDNPIKWVNKQLPTAGTNSVDVLSLTIFRVSNNYTILGKVEEFGDLP